MKRFLPIALVLSLLAGIAHADGPLNPGGGGTSLTPGQLPGTTTNDSANAGNVGQYLSAQLASGSAVSLTTNTAANITSITLTPGDWDVTGNGVFTMGGTTNVSYAIVGLSTVSATRDGTVGNESFAPANGTSGSNGNTPNAIVGPVRYSVTTNTTVYLYAFSGFATSTAAAWGTIRARRVR